MKRKFVWLIVSCLVVAALLMASCGPAEEEVVTPEEEETKEISLPPMPVDVGVRVATEFLAVTLKEMKIVDSYDCYSPGMGENITVEAPAGQLLLLAYFIVENLQKRTFYTGYHKIFLYDSEGNMYSAVAGADYQGEDRIWQFLWMDPGQIMLGWVSISFPEDKYDLKLEYRTAPLTFPETPPQSVEWVVRPSK